VKQNIKVGGHSLCSQLYFIIDPILNQRYQRPGVCVCVCVRERERVSEEREEGGKEGEREGEKESA
jgi:hypothetical protein